MVDFKRTIRRAVVTQRGTDLVLELSAVGVLVKERGRRRFMGPVSWGHIFVKAGEIEALRQAGLRKQRRVARGVRV